MTPEYVVFSLFHCDEFIIVHVCPRVSLWTEQRVGSHRRETPPRACHWRNSVSAQMCLQLNRLSPVLPGQPTTSAWRSSTTRTSRKSQTIVGLDSTMTRIRMRRWGWSQEAGLILCHLLCFSWMFFKKWRVAFENLQQRTIAIGRCFHSLASWHFFMWVCLKKSLNGWYLRVRCSHQNLSCHI